MPAGWLQYLHVLKEKGLLQTVVLKQVLNETWGLWYHLIQIVKMIFLTGHLLQCFLLDLHLSTVPQMLLVQLYPQHSGITGFHKLWRDKVDKDGTNLLITTHVC